MKKLTLSNLKLKNFKGVQSFELDAQGESINVFGDNETGKTTVFDAFVWLLFDKDSQNKKDFQLKTVMSSGEEIHNQEHEVEALFDFEDKKISFKKVYFEKWTKQRGSAEKTFTGHSTDYFVNDVPVRKKEYTDQVEAIVKEDAFKLLTSPQYFNEQFKWKERRDLLLKVCGDVSDEEVIASDEKLSKLLDVLSGRTIEEHRKIIASKKSKINEQLEKIPVRIDEVKRSIPNLDGLNETEIVEEIEQIKSQIEVKEQEIHRIQSGGEVTEKENRIREINGEIIEIKNNFQSDVLKQVNEKQSLYYKIKSEIDGLNGQVKRNEFLIKDHQQTVLIKEQSADRLRRKWHEVNSKNFEYDDHATTCPTCKQELPAEQIEEAREKALAHFNHDKASKLEKIVTEGKGHAEQIALFKKDIETYQSEIKTLNKQIEVKQAELDKVQDELNALKSNVKNVEDEPSYKAKKQEIEALNQEINQLQTSVNESIRKVRTEITELKIKKESLEQSKAKFGQVHWANERIADLEAQELQLASEFEKLEHELYLTEEFTKQKVNLLEDKINSKFKYARFKLFDVQVNGGINETCETTYKGVPYSKGLNNAARINVGLDIINTLSEYYGLSAPIFIDNAESVTNLAEVNAQVISLYVSEDDKELRVERMKEGALVE